MSDRTARAVDILARLVAFDTTSSRSNLDLIEYVRGYLADEGVPSLLSFDASGRKANIVASVGPAVPGGIVLSGHTDVVPVDGQAWSSDPFALTAIGDRLYGRGTADMKAFLAVALAMVPEFQGAGLARPLHLCFSYDEEVGCHGVHHIIGQLLERLPTPRLAIIGEPSGMEVVNAHKGVRLFETTVTGLDCHSSDPRRGASAVHAAGRLVNYLADLEDELRTRGAGSLAPAARFDPPWTTLNVGRVSGGTATNIVARSCRIDWELRLLPGQDPDEIPARFARFADQMVLPRLTATHPDAAIHTAMICDVPALAPEPDAEAEALCKRLTGSNTTRSVPFGSEAGLFQRAGFSTVICGPGSIDQAHKPDEFIERSQIAACVDFMALLAGRAG